MRFFTVILSSTSVTQTSERGRFHIGSRSRRHRVSLWSPHQFDMKSPTLVGDDMEARLRLCLRRPVKTFLPTMSAGGIPILSDGAIGAIGASGGTPAEDHHVAEVGITAL